MWTAALIIFLYFLVFFIVGTLLKNNSIVDIGWGIGFVITAWILFFLSNDYSLGKIIVNLMVSFWGLRLFYYILQRNIFKEEDFRYQNWRKEWGKWVIPRAFLQVYMLQGVFMFAVGLAVNYANIYGVTFSWWMLIGLFVWLVGYAFEVVGDAQLKRHIKNPNKETKLIKWGLWKYTRHPNYFGEAVLWWGIYLVVLFGGGPWWLFVSALVITLLVRFVSGVPMLEKRMSKYEGWDEYAAKTNAFIPWFPKKKES